ncbi:MAG: alpha/beta hydrolase [Elusimicrobia bacterium]|nr:alpha/beta hydrolase [Candidatus Obscuribacterium magneticum]
MLAFTKEGSGLPLVFIHAYPLSRKMWDHHQRAFSKNYQFVSLDMPGFGESPLENSEIKMEGMAKEILSSLDGLGIKDQAIFTGVSMGGYILFQLYKLAPDRVRGLILAATRAKADSEEGRKNRENMVIIINNQGVSGLAEKMIPSLFGRMTLKDRRDLVDKVRSWILEGSPGAAVSAQKGMAARPDSTALLSSIDVPTLVLAGADDAVVPVAEMKEMANLIPGAWFDVIEGAGHLMNLEKPLEFEERILNFVMSEVKKF